MLQEQYPAIINGVEDNKRIRYYSDAGFKIKKVDTGELFDEAIDLIEHTCKYEETNELINPAEIDDLEEISIEQ